MFKEYLENKTKWFPIIQKMQKMEKLTKLDKTEK